MAKQVIVTDEEFPRVFENLAVASKEIGATETAISLAMREGRACKGVSMRYVDRVYIVRLKDSLYDWYVAKMNAHNTAFYFLDQRKKSVRTRDVAEIKDITGSWYAKSL